MGVFQNNLMGAAAAAASAGGGGFYDHQIANSVRFTGSGRLTRTAGTPTNIDKFTISFWVKRSDVTAQNNLVFGDTDNINYQMLRFSSTEKLELHEQRGGGDSNGLRTVNQVFRDPSAWMHVVWVYDSGNSTEADREIFYVNGTRLTDVEGWDGGYPAQNRDSVFNQSGATQVIGGASAYYGNHLDGYMAEVVFNDGQAYAASNYGETKNGVWIPKDPSGLTFGDNGFYLNFASSGDLGNDVSGNNNDFSLTSIAAHDQMLDSPTFNSDSNGGNYCTFNPLNKGSYSVLSEGNLVAGSNTSADGTYPSGNMAFKTGKWYWEHLVGASFNDNYPSSTFIDISAPQSHAITNGLPWAIRYYGGGGTILAGSGNAVANMGTITIVNTGVATYGANDLISWYIDIDNKKAWIAKNGTIPNSGNPATGANPQVTWTGNPIITHGGMLRVGYTLTLNAGQDGTFAGAKTAQGNSDDTGYGNFYYAPPTGFLAMCAGNLPTADAVDPAQTDDDYPQKLFTALAYSGGTTGHVTGFKPDWVWVKARSTSQSHGLFDSTSGTTKILNSDATNAEATSSGLTAFNTDGYDMGTYYNQGANTYASWSWRANGGTTSSNATGDITSTVQVDPSGGFSIVKYTGESATRTVGHGLSATPNMIIVKALNNTYNWAVFTTKTGASEVLYLNSHGATQTGAGTLWGGSTAPTASVFSVGDGSETGKSVPYIAYCFANVEGYIKSGSYAANGNADGTFVYTGFRPAWVMIKAIDTGAEWTIYDDKRDTYNESDHILQADLADAERTDLDKIDILSNGFKCLSTGGRTNQSGKNYIYLAFASNPFKYATAR